MSSEKEIESTTEKKKDRELERDKDRMEKNK